jgi:hypothetical protein
LVAINDGFFIFVIEKATARILPLKSEDCKNEVGFPVAVFVQWVGTDSSEGLKGLHED